MTPEPQSVALIREALEAGPVGHLHSTGEYCSDRQPRPDLWPIDLFAIDRRDIAEVLQHVAALSAQVRGLEADALRYRTWLAYAFSEEEGTETFLIDTPEKMQEWLDKRARGE